MDIKIKYNAKDFYEEGKKRGDFIQPTDKNGKINPEFAKRYPKSEFLTNRVKGR
jgi:hypothetical protein